MWADRLIRRALALLESRQVPVAVRFWNGARYEPRGGARVSVNAKTRRALRALAAPSLGGLARAYVEQDIDIEGDLRDVLRVGEDLVDAATAADARLHPLLNWVRQTRSGARRSIGFHYDVSNDFFALWLDRRRVYSCAYYRSPDQTLEQAQEDKLDLICRKLALKPGEQLLDIGCGWGGLIFWAAQRYGARCLGITLSQRQHDYVAEEIARRGLTGRVAVRLSDYRELPEGEPFDKIASIGMFEHVGVRFLRGYFARIVALLKPGGLVLNHGITAANPVATGLRSGVSEFIEDYVFPGGELVHLARAVEASSAEGLECVDVESLRPHYARTLWAWVDRLDANAARAREFVGEKRYRIWRIYMAGSAHAFTRGWISIHQMLAGKPLPDGSLPYPYTREHLYGTGA
ncbi:MAG: class I SAM-dependent methyltransferase [Rhodocyclaceae bacterium]